MKHFKHLKSAISIFALGSVLTAATVGNGQAAAFATINLIDSFSVASSFTGGNFDILDNTGMAGSDGVDDVIITVTTAGAGTINGVDGEAEWDVSATGIRTAQSFSNPVMTDNPGTRLTSTITFFLASHLTVLAGDFEVDVSSINTAGISWEHSTIEFLDVAGNAFSPITTPSAYLSHTSIDGVGSVGNYHADSLGTVIGVGSSVTSSGVNGGSNNLTTAPGGDLDGLEVGLSAATQIGGIRLTTYLDDVRGTTNANTGFTATLSEVNISGDILQPVPEPESVLLSLAGLVLLLSRSRKRSV